MNFMVDAQLPRRIASWLREQGHDALHTLDLPRENRTTDEEIVALAVRDGRVVVTKDADFVESFILRNKPDRLLLISTGNISNAELEQLLIPLIPMIAAAFDTASFIEVTRFGVMIHS
jgi:predicted nuclease of predicted toxin-antitoxin system